MEEVKVFWAPGCSSCVRVKEFLADKEVSYTSVNVAADPAAMKFLATLGVRTIPVVVRGKDYVFAQSLDDVAKFVGVGHRAERLPPAELVDRWMTILDIATDTIARVPESRLDERPAARPRSIRDIANHIFQVPDAFLQTVVNGIEDWSVVTTESAPPGTDLPAILAYAERQKKELAGWWRDLDDRSCTRELKMFYGVHPMHVFLERSVWHSAQHTRQIISWAESDGIALGRRLTSDVLDGLPLPRGLWE
ncbi:Glutaredoxin [Variovorax sp. YR750]|uniref:glutaredoxin domain-containing protein n=1 Tax=Variovorax sp. YR750 TaxID=1884384 RepID=UPI0008AC8F04|nr:glutaredoxin domain-containing protein [Variovorax sp. YR750]SEM06073.1 Glutaredoxin [Variovorax sp. YR750]